jgi:hypothetical protein
MLVGGIPPRLLEKRSMATEKSNNRPETFWQAWFGYNAPWMIWIYLILLLLLIFMIVGSLLVLPGSDQDVRNVLDLAIESFKFVLGALVAAISMAVQQKFSSLGRDESEPGSSSASQGQ